MKKKLEKKLNSHEKRKQTKYPALNKKLQSKVKGELLDYDYLHLLSPDELKFLNQFSNEYINAAPVLDSEKNLIPEANLHQTPEHKKDIYDRNNARNRDLYGLVKNRVGPTKLLNYEKVLGIVESELSESIDPHTTENAYIDFIEIKQIEAMIQEYRLAMKTFTEFSG